MSPRPRMLLHVLLFFLVFLSAWNLMLYFEPDAPITSPYDFWWYFIVTSASPGLTGFIPASIGGKITAIGVFVCGAALFATTFTQLSAYSKEIKNRKLKGLVAMKSDCTDHIVVLGYREGETEAIINEILTGKPEAVIVLCSQQVKENPMPEKVHFVYGDNTMDDTLDRARLPFAKRILIYGHTDDRTIAIAIAANSRASDRAHIVVHLEKEAGLVTLHRLNPKIEAISSFRKQMLATAIINPGTTRVVLDLVSHREPNSQHRLSIPVGVKNMPYGEFLVWFKKTYDATAIAMVVDQNPDTPCILNPDSQTHIGGGMSVFYIATRPLNHVVDWSPFVQ